MSVAPSDLSGHLDSDEKTLWHGSPPAGIMFRKSDVLVVPFTFLWFGFALFWEGGVLGIFASAPNRAPVFFPLFGLMFVCVGFYIAIGRFFWDALVRGQTLYALTNRRAIILTGFPNRGLRSIAVNTATEISTEERADGAGDVFFGARAAPVRGPRGWQGNGLGGDFVFERVPDARGLLRIIRQIQSSSR
jgi:hypothetical protein